MKRRVLTALAISAMVHGFAFLTWWPPAEGDGGTAGTAGIADGFPVSPGAAPGSTASLPALRLAAAPVTPSALSPAGPEGDGPGDGYLEQVRRYLDQRARALPGISARGAALVRFEVGTDGMPRELSLARASGSAELDAAALELVRRSAPLPAPAQVLRLRVPVEFR